jgi:hypothetical protein
MVSPSITWHGIHRSDLEGDPSHMAFLQLPLNSMREFQILLSAPPILIITFSHFLLQPCSNIYLHLSIRRLSSFPSHAVSFFLTDMDCDLHRWPGPFSCSFLICSISYPSLITLSTAVSLPLFIRLLMIIQEATRTAERLLWIGVLLDGDEIFWIMDRRDRESGAWMGIWLIFVRENCSAWSS